MISGFRREIDNNFALLGHYAANTGSLLLTFRDNLSVLSSVVEIFWNYHYSLRNNPTGRSFQERGCVVLSFIRGQKSLTLEPEVRKRGWGVLTTRATLHTEWNNVYTCRDLLTFNAMSDPVRYRYITQYTRWFKYDRDWFVCKKAALRRSCATLREWSHNLHPPSCSG